MAMLAIFAFCACKAFKLADTCSTVSLMLMLATLVFANTEATLLAPKPLTAYVSDAGNFANMPASLVSCVALRVSA